MRSHATSQVIGSILAGAIGDAVGRPYEGLEVVSDVHLTGTRISNDTALTLATCEAITSDRGVVDAASIASRMAFWFNAGRVEGMGASTTKALTELSAGGHWALVGRKGEYAAGNGAAMRIAPLAFCVDPNSEQGRVLIRDVSRITHHNEEAYVGALAIALAIQAIVNGLEKDLMFSYLLEQLPDSRLRDRMRQLIGLIGCSISSVAHELGTSGYAATSVALSIYAETQLGLLGFENMISQVVAVGGDTDTLASMTGQIAGAALGFEQLPHHLVEQLENSEMIKGISAEFASVVVNEARS